MPHAQPDIPLLRRWLRRFLIAGLATIVLCYFGLRGSEEVGSIFACGLFLVFPLWALILIRAAIQLVPRRRNFFWLFPALLLFVATIECSVLFILMLITRQPLSNYFSVNSLFDIGCNSFAMATGVTGVWLLLPRRAAPNFYHCAKCNYQLQGSLHANKCPECGHFLVIGEDYPYLPQHLAALENFTHGVPDPAPNTTAEHKKPESPPQ